METVRYYERRGLMPPPGRRESGYREYGPPDVLRLRFIRNAKLAGFTLSEIARLLELRARDGASCEDVRRQASAKLAWLDERIRQLRQVRGTLARLVETCMRDGKTGDCPILDAFEDEAAATNW